MDRMSDDWVVEVSSTTGTGAYALGGAPAGTSYFTLRQRIGNGDPVRTFYVRNAAKTKWEKNQSDWLNDALCTLTYGTPDTLARNVVKSTNGDAPVSWVSGDLPLRIYIAPDSDIEDGAASGWLADDKNDIATLRRGFWRKQNHPATDWITLFEFDDGADNGIAVGKYHATARKFIPDPAAINFPPGFISGLTYALSVGDAANDITIAPGVAADSTGVYPMVLAAALTKRLDASWAVGDGNGGLDTGAVGNNSYFMWLIARSDTGVVDVLFSLSGTAPTMPANYDYKRLIGWVTRSAGANVGFVTIELPGGGIKNIWTTTPAQTLSGTLTTARSLIAMLCPAGIKVDVTLSFQATDAGSGGIRITSPDETDGAPSSGAAPLYNIICPQVGRMTASTNTSAQIAARADTTIDTLVLSTDWFEWSRR